MSSSSSSPRPEESEDLPESDDFESEDLPESDDLESDDFESDDFESEDLDESDPAEAFSDVEDEVLVGRLSVL